MATQNVVDNNNSLKTVLTAVKQTKKGDEMNKKTGAACLAGILFAWLMRCLIVEI